MIYQRAFRTPAFSFSTTNGSRAHVSRALLAGFLQTAKTAQGCCKPVSVAQQRGRIWAAALADLNFALLEIQSQSFSRESNSVCLFFPHLQGALPNRLLVLLKFPAHQPSTFQKYPQGICVCTARFSGRLSPEPYSHRHRRPQERRAPCRRLETAWQHQAAVQAPTAVKTHGGVESIPPPSAERRSYSLLLLSLPEGDSVLS